MVDIAILHIAPKISTPIHNLCYNTIRPNLLSYTNADIHFNMVYLYYKRCFFYIFSLKRSNYFI